ncbi:MAG: PAS domain-containing protein [Chloroflexi bacterium]|nr:PAS domain-containing protein [Chloroflexota bacterium]
MSVNSILIDRRQRIIFWNAAAEQILGYSKAEIMGEPCFRLFAGHTPQHTICCCQYCHIFRQVEQENPIPAFEAIVKHKDGRSLLLDISTIFPTPTNKPGQHPFLIHLFRSQGEDSPPEPRFTHPSPRIHPRLAS